ncbi:hypothetical protein [Nocardiopsis sp. L17-MgMaSL7]|uniref:hypothetical protein n=1 Tax=Nocardiopsis sp. L17-MgMaSL7 TaxID=1938893 RepID=UPI000D70C8B7|nr:hypothetical protein [Nocardiopsis sp. L17-MgMaSL7]PWV49217.1 hypothetical protein BDW27_10971 [Nocardiopsis sp. L17-MgMaSL7]
MKQEGNHGRVRERRAKSIHSPDPLVTAIASGALDERQRQALADLVQLVATEAAGDAIARDGTLMDRAIVDSGRWSTIRVAWQRLQGDLYPQGVPR